MSEICVVAPLPKIGMDFSMKVTAETGHPDHQHQDDGDTSIESQADVASATVADRQLQQQPGTPGASYTCPACPVVLTSPRELTNHLRGHNSPRHTGGVGTTSDGGSGAEDADYVCGVCQKQLSSASSLDRHVLVHSGERPFRCVHCDMSFTTNGNMNRHVRTAHGSLSPGCHSWTDSEGGRAGGNAHSDDSGNERPPFNGSSSSTSVMDAYNNNETKERLSKRKRYDNYEEPRERARPRDTIEVDDDEEEDEEEEDDGLDRTPSSGKRKLHSYYNGPDAPLGASPSCNTVVGFGDLVHLDITSRNFPVIARYECEKTLHRPVSGELARYLCPKCPRAFPCQSALDDHVIDCLASTTSPDKRLYGVHCRTPTATAATTAHNNGYGNIAATGQEDFFAMLNLQNKSANAATGTVGVAESNNNNKNNNNNCQGELADIQSILNVTAHTSSMLQLRAKAGTPDNCPVRQRGSSQASGSSGSSSTPQSNNDHGNEEEDQDVFAAEFRKMKLKGEFPCRLCNSIYPNLRALKGHSRIHVNTIPGKPFPCNICTYDCVDKNALMKHMKSHNGPRPYQCSMCNYSFTTKANCERHVRNRHGKLNREEVKSVLIYHPSEDSANDQVDSMTTTSYSPRAADAVPRDEVRKVLEYQNDVRDQPQQIQQPVLMTGVQLSQRQPSVVHLQHESRYSGVDVFQRPPSIHRPFELTYRVDELLQRQNNQPNDADVDDDEDNDNGDNDDEEDDDAYATDSDGSSSSLVNQASKRDSGSSPLLENISAEPLDLTVDLTVLDLSKKSSSNLTKWQKDCTDSSNNTSVKIEDNNNTTTVSVKQRQQQQRHEDNIYNSQKQQQQQEMLLAQAYMKANQMTAQPAMLESLYPGAQLTYPSTFAGFPNAGSLLQPFGGLFNPHHHQLFAGNTPDMTINGPLYKELVRGLRTSGGSLVEAPATSSSGSYPPSSVNQATTVTVVPSAGPSPTGSNSSKSTMTNCKASTASMATTKLIMKNGVLMQKQKQRRYRTERPFRCEHCGHGFTLRSNMERHVKQQHPQYWSQKPRGTNSTRGRPPASHQRHPPTLLQSLKQPAPRQLYQPYPTVAHQIEQQASDSLDVLERHSTISEQVKFAILAQHQKAHSNAIKAGENDTTEQQLVIDEEHANDLRTSSKAMSLLRDKLEARFEPHEKQINNSCIKQENRQEKPEDNDVDGDNEGDEEEDEDEVGEVGNCAKRQVIDPMTIVKTEIQAVACKNENGSSEGNEDLSSISVMLNNASHNYQQNFHAQYMSEEEGLVAPLSDHSGSDSVNSLTATPTFKKKKMKKKKKKSAYSLAPNRVKCPYCQRPFPWASSLNRHILTHTGQKPYECRFCPLFFTTKSNCDRHLLRKHKKQATETGLTRAASVSSPELPQESSPPVDGAATNNELTNNNSSQQSSQQEQVVVVNGANACVTAATAVAAVATINNSQFAMRNVPERPYKCKKCPSSTFSTLDNLMKHKSTKHAANSATNSGSESAVSTEPQHSPQDCSSSQKSQQQQDSCCDELKNNQSGSESQSSGVSETAITVNNNNNNNEINSISATKSAVPTKKTSPRASPGLPTSETPFKCHVYMCDSGFADRQDCLDHLKNCHEEAYTRLVDRGALEKDYDGNDQSDVEETASATRRVRVADYANRKVICAFCMRRFWSAEDLRRHMRTHTGERPYFCDVCAQRFTLKHSMLRHRKKHDSPDSAMYVGTSGDEDSAPVSSQPSTVAQRPCHQQVINSSSTSLPQMAGVAMLTCVDASENNGHSDLISNLLGIGGNVVDKALQLSPDDAAKLLGIKANQE
ncbi:uncharacterized protein LOC106635773 [Copidosoma floridanum]|uniref:uncharacterized protein LOC106635773 n=1 Tax=Copidosoma floridanum TaxID=29053 RepID=UPI0006C9B1E7|nr:uncharacterized protein LOC106635773 [Copidosoma floridanum]